MKQHKAKKMIKLLVSMLIVFYLLLSNLSKVLAIEEDSRNVLPYEDKTQYFEMRATEIREATDGTKQVIMELWGHNLIFKRI